MTREDPWLEERRGGATTFELDGIDVVSREKAEIADFQSRLKTGDQTNDRGSPFSVAAVFAALLSGWLLIGDMRWALSKATMYLLLAPAIAVPFLIAAAWSWAYPAVPLPPRARFVVRVEPGSITIEWGKRRSLIELADIDRFESGRGFIELVRRSGQRDRLPFAFKDRENNEAFARRLEDAIAARTGAGYRGAEPEPEEVDAESAILKQRR